MASVNSTTVAAFAASSDNTSPLAIFLVKSGSKGDRLLFRYPYEITDGNHNRRRPSADKRQSNLTKKLVISNPYLSLQPEDFMNTLPLDSHVKEMRDGQLNLKSSHQSLEHRHVIDPYVSTVISLSDKVLSDLFAVKPTLCGQKFEVKINDIRFVGHPISLASGHSDGGNNYCIKNREKDLLTFNVVFAVRANASHDIVNCYHDCSQRIAIALQFEENRVSYLSMETKAMLKVHDEHGEEIQDMGFKKILETSQLAIGLKKVYDDLMNQGIVHLCINNWVNVSFCLPQKVHRLTLRHHDCVPSIGPENIQSCFEHLRPYHGILLLVGTEHLKEILPQDASPAFFRIINVVTPTKNLLELSADADVSLQQVFQIVAQLVYWGKATVIYPLCETNVYAVHPLATSSITSEISRKFASNFNENLLKLLSDFSLGVTLSQLRSPLQKQTNLVSNVLFMNFEIVSYMSNHFDCNHYADQPSEMDVETSSVAAITLLRIPGPTVQKTSISCLTKQRRQHSTDQLRARINWPQFQSNKYRKCPGNVQLHVQPKK